MLKEAFVKLYKTYRGLTLQKDRKSPSLLQRMRGGIWFPVCSYVERNTVEQTWGKLARPLTHTEFKLTR